MLFFHQFSLDPVHLKSFHVCLKIISSHLVSPSNSVFLIHDLHLHNFQKFIFPAAILIMSFHKCSFPNFPTIRSLVFSVCSCCHDSPFPIIRVTSMLLLSPFHSLSYYAKEISFFSSYIAIEITHHFSFLSSVVKLTDRALTSFRC